MLKKFLLSLFLICTLSNVSYANSNSEKLDLKIGVNRFVWYASLQNINFMPVISADPFSGVILTDWYNVNDNERFKIDIYILEESLTSQSVQVRVFKQNKSASGWSNSNVSESLATKIEDSILNSARQLRVEYMMINNE